MHRFLEVIIMCLGTIEHVVKRQEQKQPIYNIRNKNPNGFSLLPVLNPLFHIPLRVIFLNLKHALSPSTNLDQV